MTHKIEETRKWSASSVRECCVRNNWYTRGDNEDYTHMLNWVDKLYPNAENLYFIAEDIQKHSEGQTVTNVMFILNKEAVNTFYTIDGSEEI